MDEQALHQLIEKVLSGIATTQEQWQLEEWFRSFNDHEVLVNTAMNKIELQERMFGNIQQQLQGKRKPKIKRLLQYGSVAAAVIVISLLSVFVIKSRWQPEKPAFVKWQAGSQMKKLILDDNTVVWLQKNSSLQYAQSNKTGNREVLLSGEAYFEVQHNADRPFVVHSGALTVTDIGTRFNIKAYAGNRQQKVMVQEGIVSASASPAKAADTMTAGQEWTFDQHTQLATVNNWSNQQNIPWQPGTIYFSNEYLDDIASQLEHRFNVQFHFSNTAQRSMKFTGIFSVNESIDHIIDIICKAENIKSKRNGNIYTLY